MKIKTIETDSRMNNEVIIQVGIMKQIYESF